MPVERTPATNTSDEELFSDASLGVDDSAPAESTSKEGLESGVQSPAGDGNEQQDVTGAKPDLGGLPFKDLTELVSGHKSLQEAYRSSRTEFYQLQQKMNQLMPLIQKWQTESAERKNVPEKPDIPKFLETFIEKGPDSIVPLIEKAIEARLGSFQNQLLSPVQAQLKQIQTSSQIDNFIRQHPEVTEDDEQEIIGVLQENPWLEQIQAFPQRLEMAYNMLLRKNPEHFSSRSNETRTGLTDMKSAAAGVGTKGGSRTRSVAANDEFDAVLSSGGGSRWG